MNMAAWRSRLQSSPAYPWWVVMTVCVGAFMAALDASIINIALPALQRGFHIHMAVVSWVSLIYMLTLAALIVPFSRLADMFGKRTMYTLGFSVFLVGSLGCGMSESIEWMFGARVVQAAGAAMLQANSVAIIMQTTPERDRGKAIGIQASAQGIGLSLGPFLGGVLVAYFGWRWIFYVNVPVGILGTLLGLLTLPSNPPLHTQERFDLLGTLCFFPTLVAFVYVLNQGIHVGLTSPSILVCDVMMVLGFVGFVVAESRARYPLVDLSLFQRPTFLYGNLSVLLSFAVMYAVLFLTPFELDHVRHLNVFTAGLFMTVIPIGMTMMTPVAGIIADSVSVRLPTLVGMMSAAAGCLLMATSLHQSTMVGTVIGLLLLGCGMGLFTPANNSQVMGCAPSNRMGIAGGVLNTARTIGMGVGVSFGGLSYQLFLRQYGVYVDSQATTVEMSVAFRDSYLATAIIALVVVGVSLGVSRLPRNRAT